MRGWVMSVEGNPQRQSRGSKVSLRTLQQIVVDAAAAHTVEQQVERIVTGVRDALAVGVCSLYQRFDDELIMVANCGFAPESVGRIVLQMGEGLIGHIARSRMPLNLAEAQTHSAFRLFPGSGEEAFPAFLGVPIMHLGVINGVLVVQDARPGSFSNDEESFLVTIAAQLAPVLLPRAGLRGGVGRAVRGIGAAPGKALGHVHLLLSDQTLQLVEQPAGEDAEHELAVLEAAISRAHREILAAKTQLGGHAADDVLELFDVYISLLSGDQLVAAARRRIGEGSSAFAAVRAAVDENVAAFEALDDEYLRARAEDIRHIGNKLLTGILGLSTEPSSDATGVVLFAGAVSISDIGAFRPEQLAGIVCLRGSSYSHATLLARALGIPAVVGTGPVDHIHQGMPVIVDGDVGDVVFDPPQPLLRSYEELIHSERALREELLAQKDLPATTIDGARVELLANTGLMADVKPGLQHGAEGIGLYRSEIPFLIGSRLPTEAEQIETYRELLETYHPLPVTMRTIDLGGDKQLPYLPVDEENPAMGWRGIRFALDNPSILMTQLRAMLRANEQLGNLKIMLPMVSNVSEVVETKSLVQTVIADLRREGSTVAMPPLGVMLEVPGLVPILPELRTHIDFVSVGTNDLVQYLLAVDRGNPRVISNYDYLHPAVLSTLRSVIGTCRRLQIEACVCGEMAADPVAVLLLVGLGYRSLSINAVSLPKIKRVIRGIAAADAERVAKRALRRRDANTTRTLATATLSACSLDHLLKATPERTQGRPAPTA